MPTLFDSHEEFNEWFSKDIENHAENKSAIDQGISLNIVFFLSQNDKLYGINTNEKHCQVLCFPKFIFD